MGALRKSWREKLYCGAKPEVKSLNKAFAGFEVGDRLLIPTPVMIDEYIRAIPKGETRTVKQMREDLAAHHNVDLTCPLCTGIFTRIVAEVANEDIKDGVKIENVSPFWRVLEPKGSLRKKVSFDLRMADDLILSEAKG